MILKILYSFIYTWWVVVCVILTLIWKFKFYKLPKIVADKITNRLLLEVSFDHFDQQKHVAYMNLYHYIWDVKKSYHDIHQK